MSAHVLLVQLVLKRLCEWRDKELPFRSPKFFLAKEEEFDHLEKILKKHYDKPVPDELYGKLYEQDEDCKLLLHTMLGLGEEAFHYAPVSKLNVLAFCLKNDVPVHFVDAAFDGPYLCASDEITSSLVSTPRGRELEQLRISAVSVEGVAIRNKVMAQRTLERAQRLEARVILLSCGRVHVFGQKAVSGLPEYPFEDSLTTQLKAKGADVIPIYITVENDKVIKREEDS